MLPKTLARKLVRIRFTSLKSSKHPGKEAFVLKDLMLLFYCPCCYMSLAEKKMKAKPNKIFKMKKVLY